MKFLNGESAARVAVRAGATGVIERRARGFGTWAIIGTAGFALAAALVSTRRADFAADVLPVGAFTPDACPEDTWSVDDPAASDFVAPLLAADFAGAAAVRVAGLPVEGVLPPVAAGRAALPAGLRSRFALPADLPAGPVGVFFAGTGFAAAVFATGGFGADPLAADCFAAGTFAAGSLPAVFFADVGFADVLFAAGRLAVGCFAAGIFADLVAGVRVDGLAPDVAAGLVAALVPLFDAALPVDPRLFPADAAMAGLWFLKFLMPQ